MRGGHLISNLYDYDGNLLVASVTNADPIVDNPTYTSFETDDYFQTNAYNKWSLTGTAAYSSSAITGNRSFILNNNTLTASPLNTSKGYKISYWATGSVTISGGTATLAATATGINGFTYYEYNIAAGASSISVSGNGNIDELRLYPQNARMTSTTYDPVIGKTSECDENNKVTYYLYDNLGRLQFIKDDHNNVIKMYEYNVISKQNGCPNSYGNHYISETFTRNDCDANHRGTSVTYSINANTYTSTISQADADAQAETELFSNAQSYANSHGACQLIYYNKDTSQTFISQNCGDGYRGGTVTYTVPANRYSSVISQADADAQAVTELNANGQAYANDPAHQVCIIDYTPQWEGTDSSSTACQLAGGLNTGHKLMWMTDVNPNSTTYNVSQWMDVGIDTSACPVSPRHPNLLINGDFENGAGSFGTDYTYVASGTEVWGDYMVGSNPHNYNTGFCSMSNHTSGGSKMLIVDGSVNTADRFWYNVINVKANTNYTFSYWCASLDNLNSPILQLKINGTVLSTQTIATTCTWQLVQVTWNSGSNVTALIEMNSQSAYANGNDFSIDDMSFTQQ